MVLLSSRSIESAPPCDSATDRAMVRPIPVPSGLVESNGMMPNSVDSCAKPGPESETTKSTIDASDAFTSTTMVPAAPLPSMASTLLSMILNKACLTCGADNRAGAITFSPDAPDGFRQQLPLFRLKGIAGDSCVGPD